MAGEGRIVDWPMSTSAASDAVSTALQCAQLARATDAEIAAEWRGYFDEIDAMVDAELARRARLEDEDGE